MKKVKSMIIKMFVLLSFLMVPFIPAIKTNAEESKIIVYAKVPDSWIKPCLWAWNDDGTNAFDAWPGGSMTADENNEGWYYCYVDKNVGNNIIMNANEGSVQTSDYKTEGKNIWVTIAEDGAAEISVDQLTQGKLPAYEETFTIYVKAPQDWSMPCLWAWSAPDGTNVFANWPGQELTLGTDGWNSYELPVWVNSIIVNANLGEVQTTDITVEAKDLWLTVTDAENTELSYEKPIEEKASETMITVHARVPQDWIMPCLWAWSAPDGTNVFANWPGQELTPGDDGWYTYEIPDWVNTIIINGSLGEVQTTDIAIDSKDVWVTVQGSENFDVAYEKPSADIVADTGNAADESKVTDGIAEENTDEAGSVAPIAIIIFIVVIIAAGGTVGYMIVKRKKGGNS